MKKPITAAQKAKLNTAMKAQKRDERAKVADNRMAKHGWRTDDVGDKYRKRGF